jgi:hypothetical protein
MWPIMGRPLRHGSKLTIETDQKRLSRLESHNQGFKRELPQRGVPASRQASRHCLANGPAMDSDYCFGAVRVYTRSGAALVVASIVAANDLRRAF